MSAHTPNHLLHAVLKRLTPQSLKRRIKTYLISQVGESYGHTSYAQEGEDLILARLFGLFEWEKEPGFYVDVGAHHPQKFSNTFFFYLQGWHGINIDASPGSMSLFNALRPKDINLELAISDSQQTLTFYQFNDSALNGFSSDMAALRDNYTISDERGSFTVRVLSQQSIQTTTLAEVLEKQVPKGQAIDFLSVDVEGLDYAVLKSNDWTNFRPKIVLVEDSDVPSIDKIAKSSIIPYMAQQGYLPCCKTPLTLFFLEERLVEIGPLGLRLKSDTSPKAMNG